MSDLIENNITNEYFLGKFRPSILLSCKGRIKVSGLIENNMRNEYFLGEFSSGILLSCKGWMKVNK